MILANYFHEGVYDWERSKIFFELWSRNFFPKSPDVYAANAYDAVWMIAAAVRKVGADRYDIMRWLRNSKWKGASGFIKVGPDRLEKNFVLQEWKNGELVLIDRDIVQLSE